MGAALDSFILIISIAGPISLLVLIWCLVTRLMRRPQERGLFQRFPVLLPSVLFVISVIVISQIGILPMAQDRGENYVETNVTSGDILEFEVYNSDIVYSEQFQLNLETFMVPGDSMNVTVSFFLEDHVIRSINVTLLASETEDFITEGRTLQLSSGFYVVQVNDTYFESGVPDVMPHALDVTLWQPVKPSFIDETVRWSTIQFGLNVGCFFLILGGLCLGGPSKSRYVEEKKQEDMQTDHGAGAPEYGKGC
jgi:hypothetical protein